MTLDAQPAGSSPAAEQPTDSDSNVLSSLSSSEYETWNRTGELPAAKPEDKKATPPADSSTAKPAEQAGSTDSTKPPASEPGKPPTPGHKGNAETRERELAAQIEASLRKRAEIAEEIRREEARLQALRQPPTQPTDGKPAASSATAAPTPLTYPAELATFEAYAAGHPDASYEDYMDARGDFRHEHRAKAQRETEAKAREAQETAQRDARRVERIRERDTKYAAQIATVKATEPDFLSTISPAVLELRPYDALQPGETAGPLNELAERLLSSSMAPQVMRHFTAHPEDLQRFAKLEPVDFLVEWGKLEVKLEQTPPADAPKHVTEAPEPPPTVGRRPAEPANELHGALARGDYAAYEAAANKRDLAAAGRR